MDFPPQRGQATIKKDFNKDVRQLADFALWFKRSLPLYVPYTTDCYQYLDGAC
jgi:hypothetical protein